MLEGLGYGLGGFFDLAVHGAVLLGQERTRINDVFKYHISTSITYCITNNINVSHTFCRIAPCDICQI